MFFIGIFGINQGKKELPVINNADCPLCGHMTHLKAYKTYSYFHIFFIPTFRWNVQYWIHTDCCNTLAQLDPDIGKDIEAGMKPVILERHLQTVGRSTAGSCPVCGAHVEGNFKYCPHCGSKIS